MGKRNRDKLLEQSMYDMLVKMNERAMPKICVLDLLGDKQCRCNKYICEKYIHGCMNSCEEKYKCCKKCIANWMNEDPF